MAEVQFRFRDDEPVGDPAVTVDSFGEQSNAAAVRIEPGDDVAALLPHLGRLRLIVVNFPVWTDGRGFTAARSLREAGYAGELRACGDVVVDRLAALRRCGFDSFAPERALDPADAEAAFARWPFEYQATGDGRPVIWALRHPA